MRKPKKDDLTFIAGAAALLVKGGKAAYEQAKYAMGGTRVETFTVKKITKGTKTRTPSLSGVRPTFLGVRLSGISLGTSSDTWIVESEGGSQYLIAKGNLSLKKIMRVGETYTCKVYGDPDWGIPKIVELLGSGDTVVPEAEIDNEPVII